MSRLLLILSITSLVGCSPKAPAPTAVDIHLAEPMVNVVQQIDANNQLLPTIWALHDYEANVVDEQGKSQFFNGDGAALYRRPAGFRLVGKKDVVGDVFEIGCTDEFYWLKMSPPNVVSRLWFGEQKNAGKPCVEKVPIQPNLVAEVLGIGLIGTDFTQMPSPVMRFNPDADQYMFLWVMPGGGPGAGPQRLVAQREVWYDRKTKLPTLVILFDADGRPLLRANLSGHAPVSVPDVPEQRWPRLARNYQLYFTENRSTLSLTLKTVQLTNGKGIPDRRGIVFPGSTPDEAGVGEVIKLDQNCKE